MVHQVAFLPPLQALIRDKGGIMRKDERENIDKRKLKEHKQGQDEEESELNYNDRLDGYGFGPPEYMDDKYEFEHHRKRLPEVTRDEYGQRNPWGPMDQYSFRDKYERRWSKPNSHCESGDDDDWREWGRERYQNDDHSRYPGPHFHKDNKGSSSGEVLTHSQPSYPGVSGKTYKGERWFNRDKYQEQREFMGKGPKGYRRSDDRIYETVCETLLDSPDIDATNIGVRVEEGLVFLEGHVSSRAEKRLAEYLIEDLPGVEDVRNLLSIEKFQRRGPSDATEKDLGVRQGSGDQNSRGG
jgi:hypothetical protein